MSAFFIKLNKNSNCLKALFTKFEANAKAFKALDDK